VNPPRPRLPTTTSWRRAGGFLSRKPSISGQSKAPHLEARVAPAAALLLDRHRGGLPDDRARSHRTGLAHHRSTGLSRRADAGRPGGMTAAAGGAGVGAAGGGAATTFASPAAVPVRAVLVWAWARVGHPTQRAVAAQPAPA
jgi:hypothetical protein